MNEFKIDLQNRYAALEEQQDDSNNSIPLNDMNNNITEPLIGAGKKWKSSTKRNSKFSVETKNFMENRRNLKTPTAAKEKIEATELNKLFRKKQRNDLRKHKATTIQRVIEQSKSFKMAKRQLNRGRLQFTCVLEEDGTLTTDRERIVESSREFYEKLLINKSRTSRSRHRATVRRLPQHKSLGGQISSQTILERQITRVRQYYN